MDNAEVEQRQQYPMLALSDEELLERILAALEKSVSSVADPYGAFGELEAQLEQLAMDARCSPSRIICRHAKDQIAQFLPQGPSSHRRAAP